MNNSVKNEMWSYVKTLIFALVLSFLIQHFLLQPYTVKGQSMMPNLKEGNKIIISKINYEPEHFDMVVLKSPHSDEFLVKRIIGLPGDSVRYIEDVLYINSKPHEEPYLEKFKSKLPPFEQLTEDFSVRDLIGKPRIPDGYMLVLGDNRRVSRDGRHFGLVKTEDIVGKVNARYWPIKEVALID